MTVSRVLTAIAGGILLLFAVAGFVLAGWSVAVFGLSGRYEVPVAQTSSTQAAIYVNRFDVDPAPYVPDGIFDTHVVATSPTGQALFLGVGTTSEVQGFLAGAAYEAASELVDGAFVLRPVPGNAVAAPAPQSVSIWEISAAGDPARLPWSSSEGDNVLVVMNEDGSMGVSATLTATLSLPFYLLYLGLLLVASLAATLAGARLLFPGHWSAWRDGLLRRIGR